jgi:hypothetical protein
VHGNEALTTGAIKWEGVGAQSERLHPAEPGLVEPIALGKLVVEILELPTRVENASDRVAHQRHFDTASDLDDEGAVILIVIRGRAATRELSGHFNLRGNVGTKEPFRRR